MDARARMDARERALARSAISALPRYALSAPCCPDGHRRVLLDALYCTLPLVYSRFAARIVDPRPADPLPVPHHIGGRLLRYVDRIPVIPLMPMLRPVGYAWQPCLVVVTLPRGQTVVVGR